MAGWSTYAQQKALDHIRGKASWTMPSNNWIALFTEAPTDAGGGTEAAYTGYARVQTTAADWASASGIAGANAAALNFPTCAGGTSAVVAFAAFDQATGGNMLYWGTCSLAVSTGITPGFGVGQLSCTLD